MANPNLLTNTSAVADVLCSQRLASTAETTVYTAPANSSTSITHGTLCNVTASAVTVSLSVVGSGGTADGTHRVIASYSLPAYDTLSLRDYLAGAKLGEGDFVSLVASTADAIVIVLSGVVSS